MREEKLLRGFRKLLKSFKIDLENRYIQRKCLYTVDMLLDVLNDLSPTTGYSSALAINGIRGTKDGFCKFRQKFLWPTFYKLFRTMGDFIQNSRLLSKNRVFNVDGSKISLLNIFKECGYNLKTSDNFVNGSITAIIEADSKNPVEMIINNDGNERRNLMDLLDRFLKGDIFVMDAGYYSFKLAKSMTNLGLQGLFRVTTSLNEVKKLRSVDAADTVVSMRQGKSKMDLRLLKCVVNGNIYYLATTLLDKAEYPSERLLAMYLSRWTIESYFRLLKDIGLLADIHAQNENGMKQEFYLHIVRAQMALALQPPVPCLPQPRQGYKTKSNDTVMLNYVIRRFRDLARESMDQDAGLISKMASDISYVIKANRITFKLNRHYPRIVRIPRQQIHYVTQTQKRAAKTKSKRLKKLKALS